MSGDGGSHDDDEIHEEHEEHANHEAWVIPYADLLTLLMAMFIALFAISSVNADKAKRLEMGFNNAGKRPSLGLFSSSKGNSTIDGVGKGDEGGDGILEGSQKPDENASQTERTDKITASSAVKAAEKKEQESFWQLKERIESVAESAGVGSNVSVELQGRGLVVRLVNDNVLFASGQATIEPAGIRVLETIGAVLYFYTKNSLIVEGYTDDRPIHTSEFASNWELSTARANVVLRYLIDTIGLSEERMTAQGFGARNPVESNATEAGRAKNRRVEIVIESNVIQQILEANDLTNKTVEEPKTKSTPPTTAAAAKPDLSHVVGDLSGGH